jgi:signal peptidase I
MQRKHTLSTVRIKGISMFPTLRTGQLAAYQACSAQELRIGDIVIFKTNHKLVCHRLLLKCQIQDQLILLEKGDNPFYQIARLAPATVVGKMAHRPGIAWWVALATLPGIFLGYILFTLKKLLFKNRPLGIIERLSKFTSVA